MCYVMLCYAMLCYVMYEHVCVCGSDGQVTVINGSTSAPWLFKNAKTAY